MDVSATGQPVAAAVSQDNVGTVTGSVPAPAPQEAANAVITQGTSSSGDTNTSSSQQPADNRSALAPAIAKLFSVPSPKEPTSLNVSYKIEGASDTIVTVFTDPTTGQEVAQIPPEVLIQIAQFFDQQQGATLDKSA
jgi:uncharacterized FlaG/YvyC family protein